MPEMPCREDVIFSTKAPITIRITPGIVWYEGNSPSITGEVIRRKAGVKDKKGTVSDSGEIRIARIYRKKI